MSDELEQVQEVQGQEVEKPIEEKKPEVQQETQKEQNLRILRERAENAERRAAEMEQYLRSSQQPQQQQVPEEDNDELDIKDDDFIEGKHLKKYVKSLKKELKEAKKQFVDYNQQTALATAEVRLKSQFNDFDNVVTKDNLEKLAATKPALYRTIMANQDIYDRGYVAYEMIKSANIGAEDYSKQEKRIEENRNKPRSASTAAPQTSDNPLTRVGDYDRRVLTEERKEQLRRQVEEAKRNR